MPNPDSVISLGSDPDPVYFVESDPDPVNLNPDPHLGSVCSSRIMVMMFQRKNTIQSIIWVSGHRDIERIECSSLTFNQINR